MNLTHPVCTRHGEGQRSTFLTHQVLNTFCLYGVVNGKLEFSPGLASVRYSPSGSGTPIVISRKQPLPDSIQPLVAHTTGLFPCKCWLFRRPASTPTRTLRHPETIRGLGLGHPLFEPRRRQCPVFRCTYRPSQNRERLVGRRPCTPGWSTDTR